MKSRVCKKLDVDPLVFQTYKTLVCLLTSFAVLFLGVERLTFSPWGIMSGLFWVPAGTAHVCAVRTAGLAISQGTASSIAVMVSFGWGIFVFGEQVKSLTSACSAILFMVMGIIGMSYFSSLKAAPLKSVPSDSSITLGFKSKTLADTGDIELMGGLKYSGSEISESDEEDGSSTFDSDLIKSDMEKQTMLHNTQEVIQKAPMRSYSLDCDGNSGMARPSRKRSRINKYDSKSKLGTPKFGGGAHAIVLGIANVLRQRKVADLSVEQMGLVLTAVGACWGGSVMVPLHYAGSETQGLNFIFSFAVGATIVNLGMWIIRYKYAYIKLGNSHKAAYESLPAFHLRKMALPGGISGLLWSIGNMCSIISVTYLGQGVGYSVTQSAMLISGMWGIFYFHEITNSNAIRGWMASACLTITGILLLSFNHVTPSEPVLKH